MPAAVNNPSIEPAERVIFDHIRGIVIMSTILFMVQSVGLIYLLISGGNARFADTVAGLYMLYCFPIIALAQSFGFGRLENLYPTFWVAIAAYSLFLGAGCWIVRVWLKDQNTNHN